MELYLARHGNTFNLGDPVVWVGSQNDLPLVASGEGQARALGRLLANSSTVLSAVYTGPLKRMTAYAAIVLAELNAKHKLIVDSRLNEIDYGKWSGLTTAEVCQQFGAAAFERWDKHSEWPAQGEWGESAALVSARIRDFADELTNNHAGHEKILLVASNGCLRYFLDLIPGAWPEAKMATGHISKLVYADGVWKVEYWNQVINLCRSP